MKFVLTLLGIILSTYVHVCGQSGRMREFRDSVVSQSHKLPSLKNIKTRGSALASKYLHNRDSSAMTGADTTGAMSPAATIQPAAPAREYHIGWPEGTIPEYNNAYTLSRHEFRLNVFGRSTYAISGRSELSTLLPLVFMPNLSFKHRFIETGHCAVAYEVGGAAGLIPVAFATGIVMPGAVLGVSGIGAFTGNDIYAKGYFSYKPGRKLTFSLRGSFSRIKISYHGISAFAGAGGSGGGGVGVVPTDFKIVTTNYMMVGAEADLVLNKRNALVANTSFSRFDGQPGGILYPSLYFTHASGRHFHYSAGLFKVLDVPHYYLVKKPYAPVDPYFNIYWIFNNGHKVKY